MKKKLKLYENGRSPTCCVSIVPFGERKITFELFLFFSTCWLGCWCWTDDWCCCCWCWDGGGIWIMFEFCTEWIISEVLNLLRKFENKKLISKILRDEFSKFPLWNNSLYLESGSTGIVGVVLAAAVEWFDSRERADSFDCNLGRAGFGLFAVEFE